MSNPELIVGIGADLTALKKALAEGTQVVNNFAKETEAAAGDTEKLDKVNQDFSNTMGGLMSAIDNAAGGLTGVRGGFRGLYRSVSTATKGMNSFKAALIATGIGALIVALGYLVSHWDDLENAISDTYKAIKKLNAEREKIKDGLEYINAELKLSKLQIAHAEGLGKSTAKLIEQRKDLLRSKLMSIAEDRKALILLIAELKLREKELTIRQKIDNFFARLHFQKPTHIFREGVADDITEANLALKLTESGVEKVQIEIDKLNGKWITTAKVAKKAARAMATALSGETIGIGGEVDSGAIDPTNAITVMYEKFDAAAFAIKERMQAFNDEMRELINGSLYDTFSDLGTAIGEALASGTSVIGAIGGALLQSLGAFLSKMGGLLIKYGMLAVAKGKIDAALKTAIGTIPAGLAAIAVGIALKAAGGAIGSAASGGTSSATSSSSSSQVGTSTARVTHGGYGGGTYVFEIAGTKLIGVLKNTLDRNRALGGSLSIT